MNKNFRLLRQTEVFGGKNGWGIDKCALCVYNVT